MKTDNSIPLNSTPSNEDRRAFIKKLTVSGMALGLPGITGNRSSEFSLKNNSERKNSLTGIENPKTVNMQDNGKPLINPDMGINFFFYDNVIDIYGAELAPSDTLDYFPGLSTIYFRFPWSFVEPEEGEFNWELVDTPAQRWIDKGLKIALRITAYESWLYYATPKWVQDAGARGDVPENMLESQRHMKAWRPDFGDPVFLEKLDNFLRRMAERYDGNPNVAFVDIGSFGVWGEGHFAGESAYLSRDQGIKKHIDLYVKNFKNTLIAANDDFYKPGLHEEDAMPSVLTYALSKGVTLRDDSIMVNPEPNAWYSEKIAGMFWPSLPVIVETGQFEYGLDINSWSPDLLIKSVEEYHASYLSIHAHAKEYYEYNKDALEVINRRIGYRLQLREVKYTSTVQLGQEFKISASLANAGVAPCYKGGYICFTIKDEEGGFISVLVNRYFNVKRLEVGKPDENLVETVESSFTIAPGFPNPNNATNRFSRLVPKGDYTLYFSIGRLDGTPLYELPYEEDDGHKRYKIGRIKII